MAGGAFHGDPALRREAVERLTTHAAAGRVRPGPLAWAGDAGGSVVACLIDADDLDVWVQHLGLPKWLALALDALCAARPTVEDAVDTGVQLVEAIRPGVDVAGVGGRYVVALLDDATAAVALPAEVAAGFERIRGLQRRAAGGAAVAPNEWRDARRAATALTDALADPALGVCCRCLEAAAWDPVLSRTAVLDTLRTWQRALDRQASVAFGWTPADDSRTQALLDDLAGRYRADHPEDTRGVFELLEALHPADAARLAQRTAFRQRVGEVNGRRAATLLAGLLALAQ